MHSSPLPEKCARWRSAQFVLLGLVIVAWFGLSIMNAWFGELNQDEGWYLYAAGQFSDGKMPYRDFAFTQPPMLPLMYGVLFNWVRHLGVVGGRAVTWLFGALGTLVGVWLAMRTGPAQVRRLSGGLCLILLTVNVFQSYFSTIVKTYSLASMFLLFGLGALLLVNRQRGFRAAFAAGFLLACATATRISFGAALALGGLWLLCFAKRVKRWAWLDYGLGGLLGLAMTCLPFYILGRDGFLFGVLEYHTLRDTGPLGTQLIFKAGCLIRLIQAYFPAILLGLGLLLSKIWQRALAPLSPALSISSDEIKTNIASESDISGFPHAATLFWSMLAALALVHFSAPFPYDDYQVPVYPLFCVALAAALARGWVLIETCYFSGESAIFRGTRRMLFLTVTLLLCGFYALTSPLLQSWFIAGRDRIWWQLREKSPMRQLKEAASWVRELNTAAEGNMLFTQDTYLAVEAGLPVPSGLEMGPFSYYPEWSTERTEALHVMNRETMLHLLRTETNAPIVALSGYGLSIQSPSVTEVTTQDHAAFRYLLEQRFEQVETIPSFGQAATPLVLWRLKAEARESAP